MTASRRRGRRTDRAHRRRHLAGRAVRASRAGRTALTLAATVPGLGLLLAACGNTFSGTTLSAQVTSWATTTKFSASMTTLQGDIRRIDALGDDPGPLRTDCDVLVTDALVANQNLPSPDPTLTDLLATAYSVAGDAGHRCLTTAGGTAGQRARSAVERTTARRDLIKALARFDAVTTG